MTRDLRNTFTDIAHGEAGIGEVLFAELLQAVSVESVLEMFKS